MDAASHHTTSTEEMKTPRHLDRRFFLKSVGVGAATIAMPRILFGAGSKKSGGSLVERLGYPKDARVLITAADEFGLCHAANLAVFEMLEVGLLKSADWMAISAWSREAADYVLSHPGTDVGVHLTLTVGGGRRIAWRPLLGRKEVPGLFTPEGRLWGNGKQAWAHATADEIKRESRAQIEHALELGMDPTHLSAHDGIRSGDIPKFGKLYGELGKDYGLPVRMPPTQEQLTEQGYPDLRPWLSKMGVLMAGAGTSFVGRTKYRQVFHDIPPGTVFEVYPHPCVDCPETRAIKGKGWKTAVDEYELFTKDRAVLEKAIKDEGLILMGWRPIRDLQRAGG